MPALPATPHVLADPVFMDRSGRRRRLAKIVGFALAAVLTASLGVLAAGLVGAEQTPTSPPNLPGEHPDLGPAGVAPAPTPGQEDG